MRPVTRLLIALALLGVAGAFVFQGGRLVHLRDAERRAVQSYRAARVQTDDAFARLGRLRDSVATSSRRVDTVVRVVSRVADTLRVLVAASPSPDSVTIDKVSILAWATRLDRAVNEVSAYRVQVDSLLQVQHALLRAQRAERAVADSLLAIKDVLIKEARKQGRKEGVAVGFVVLAAGWLILK